MVPGGKITHRGHDPEYICHGYNVREIGRKDSQISEVQRLRGITFLALGIIAYGQSFGVHSFDVLRRRPVVKELDFDFLRESQLEVIRFFVTTVRSSILLQDIINSLAESGATCMAASFAHMVINLKDSKNKVEMSGMLDYLTRRKKQHMARLQNKVAALSINISLYLSPTPTSFTWCNTMSTEHQLQGGHRSSKCSDYIGGKLYKFDSYLLNGKGSEPISGEVVCKHVSVHMKSDI